MNKKLLVGLIILSLLVLSLSSVATVSASVSRPRAPINASWCGNAAVAQFEIPLCNVQDGDAETEQLIRDRYLVITAVLAQPDGSPSTWLIAGACLEGDCAIWVKQEVSQLDFGYDTLYATIWVPVQIGRCIEVIRIELSWVVMPPLFTADQITTVLVDGCSCMNIYCGSYAFAQAYASVAIWNTCLYGYSYDALVAEGCIDMNLHGFMID